MSDGGDGFRHLFYIIGKTKHIFVLLYVKSGVVKRCITCETKCVYEVAVIEKALTTGRELFQKPE